MPFISSIPARERILLYSEPACGKSHAVTELGKLLSATQSPSHIYVIDNDKSYTKSVALNGLSNISVFEVYEWPEYGDALSKIFPQLHRDDWFVCDLASEAWPAVQEYYTQEVFGEDTGSFFLRVKTELQRDTEFGGWTDWKYINKLYSSFMRPFIYKSPCHIIACSTADPVARSTGSGGGRSSVGDDRETISVFGGVGHKPSGQKRLKHQFDSTLFLHKDLRGRYLYTSVKDRGRPLHIGEPMISFPLTYLKGVAGWQIQ